MKTKLVLFEGIDGSGKSVTMKKVEEELISLGYKVKCFKDPSDSNQELRKFILEVKKKNKFTDMFLYIASRMELIEDIQNTINSNEYDYILLDRFDWSSYVYQTLNKGLQDTVTICNILDNVKELYNLEFSHKILFNIDLETLEDRLKSRNQSDLYDEIAINNHKNIICKYNGLFDMENYETKTKYCKLNIAKDDTIEQIVNQVLQNILE